MRVIKRFLNKKSMCCFRSVFFPPLHSSSSFIRWSTLFYSCFRSVIELWCLFSSFWACKRTFSSSSSITKFLPFWNNNNNRDHYQTLSISFLLSFKSVDVELLFDENYCSFIVDVAVVFWLVMTATGTLLVKYRSSTHNNIKSSSSSPPSHHLLKRHRRQANLLTRKYFDIEREKKFAVVVVVPLLLSLSLLSAPSNSKQM